VCVLELLNEVRFGGVAERLEIREDTRGLGQTEITLGTVPIDSYGIGKSSVWFTRTKVVATTPCHSQAREPGKPLTCYRCRTVIA
jgi:hypothetical protein